jgi:NAD(P)-dependent dehydrogenase (short-subunit alcohol dehydrogenase family)
LSSVEDTVDYAGRLRLDGRTFVVLGAGQGIGRQTAHALAQSGATVCCVDRDPTLAGAVADEVGGLAITADVTDRADVERVFSVAAAGTGPIRGVVDIVGLNVPGPLAALDDADWRRQFRVVVDHAFLAVQIGGRVISQAGGGSMVFVGSIAGTVTTGARHPAYGSAKAALHHLVAYAGKELAEARVRVNAVSPGVVLTPRSASNWSADQVQALAGLIPWGRPGDPSEIASAVLFLASDLSGYMTSQVMTVDGGLSGTLRLDLL